LDDVMQMRREAARVPIRDRLAGAPYRAGILMDDTDAVSSLIGDIYDAALDPALWPGVLAKITIFVGGLASALYSKDATVKSGTVF
jgi:hypothetical protein